MLRGLGDIAKLGNLMKQAMEAKQRIEELKERLGDERVHGDAGAGLVRVEINGKMDVLSVRIDPSLSTPEQRDILETMVQAAVNDAVGKAQDLVKSKMSEIAGGLDIPGLG